MLSLASHCFAQIFGQPTHGSAQRRQSSDSLTRRLPSLLMTSVAVYYRRVTARKLPSPKARVRNVIKHHHISTAAYTALHSTLHMQTKFTRSHQGSSESRNVQTTFLFLHTVLHILSSKRGTGDATRRPLPYCRPAHVCDSNPATGTAGRMRNCAAINQRAFCFSTAPRASRSKPVEYEKHID